MSVSQLSYYLTMFLSNRSVYVVTSLICENAREQLVGAVGEGLVINPLKSFYALIRLPYNVHQSKPQKRKERWDSSEIQEKQFIRFNLKKPGLQEYILFQHKLKLFVSISNFMT